MQWTGLGRGRSHDTPLRDRAAAVVPAGPHGVRPMHAATLTHKGARHRSETHERCRHDDHTVARYVVPPPEAGGASATCAWWAPCGSTLRTACPQR